MRHFLLTTGVLFSVALVDCSQSPQEQYDAAVESVNEAQSAIQEARKKVEKTEEKIAEAREDHQEAQQTLEEENRGLPRFSARFVGQFHRGTPVHKHIFRTWRVYSIEVKTGVLPGLLF